MYVDYYCELLVTHTVRGVGGLGIRMLTLDTKTSLYTEDRGLQVPMVLTTHIHTTYIHKIVGTYLSHDPFRTFRQLELTAII